MALYGGAFRKIEHEPRISLSRVALLARKYDLAPRDIQQTGTTARGHCRLVGDDLKMRITLIRPDIGRHENGLSQEKGGTVP